MLTQRIFGYNVEGTASGQYRDSYGTARFDLSGMQEGDVCGLCVFQDPYGYVGVKKTGGQCHWVYYRSGFEQDGCVVEPEEITGDLVPGNVAYLRAVVNFGTNRVNFYYSTDNGEYVPFGKEWTMRYTLNIFVGNRFGLFNYATRALGGYVDVDWFSTEPEFSEEKYYSEGTLNVFTEADLTLASLTASNERVCMLPGERYTLELTATFRSGRSENVSGQCRYEFSEGNVVKLENGYLNALADGEVEVTAYYTDFMGNTLNTSFTVAVATFPLTKEDFNPSIYANGTFDEAMGCLKTGQWGFGGWQYEAGLDISAYKYLVVRLQRPASCQPSFRLFDGTSYWSTPYMYDMGTKTEAKIDLHNMVKSDGTKCNPSNIYIAGFWTTGSGSLYIKEVFLSDDGVNPSGVQGIGTDNGGESKIVSVAYYSLSGQMYAAPQRGVNIVRRAKADGTVDVRKEFYK